MSPSRTQLAAPSIDVRHCSPPRRKASFRRLGQARIVLRGRLSLTACDTGETRQAWLFTVGLVCFAPSDRFFSSGRGYLRSCVRQLRILDYSIQSGMSTRTPTWEKQVSTRYITSSGSARPKVDHLVRRLTAAPMLQLGLTWRRREWDHSSIFFVSAAQQVARIRNCGQHRAFACVAILLPALGPAQLADPCWRF